MTRAQEKRDFSLKAFRYIVGQTNDRPDVGGFSFDYFIDARSRVTELRKMRLYHPAVKSGWRKKDFIIFFCSLTPKQRSRLVKDIPDMIIALPSDCKNFKIERPKGIARRSASFKGAVVEYDVYSVNDFLDKVDSKALVKQ